MLYHESMKIYQFEKHAKVRWSGGDRTVFGTVEEHFSGPFSLKLNGRWVSKVATIEKPVYLVSLRDGRKMLKEGWELTNAEANYEKVKRY